MRGLLSTSQTDRFFLLIKPTIEMFSTAMFFKKVNEPDAQFIASMRFLKRYFLNSIRQRVYYF